MGDTCTCRKFLEKSITHVGKGQAPFGNEKDAILATCDQIAECRDKYMALHRCRVCGTLWAEAPYESGQVWYQYLYPAPRTDDPVRWLNEEATGLPASF